MNNDNEIWILAAVFFLILAGKFFSSFARVHYRRKPRRHYATPRQNVPGKVTAYERALRGNFSPKPLFNKSELKIFNLLNEEITKANSKYRVMGQAPLPEILNTDSKYKKGGSYHAITNRRVDFVVIDQFANVVFAVEYHGSGHHQGNSLERDQIKAVALHKAGIPLFVIEAYDKEADLRERIRTQILPLTGVASKAEGDRRYSFKS